MTASGPVTRASWRPEIQALRALAIAAVVTYHAWPGLLPGGQVGVDIFFVVSGYLITGMLLREHARTGRVRLGAFALRRARRLLPSALLVLGACGVLTALVMPEVFRGQLVREIVASALSVQNWNLNLAGLADAEPLADSPLRHYWSLSVEEQFYLVWPALLAALLAIGSRLTGGVRVVIVAITAITVASFLWNLHLTSLDSSLAYFSTLARAWEFGVGAILAAMPPSTMLAPVARAVLSWVGLGAITAALVTPIDPADFPGAIVAVPVLATVAVIWAGDPEVRGSPTILARLPAVTWLGDISYALYLWHWPLIAFTPFITGQPSPWWLVALLIGLSVVLAWLTTRFIEQPIRTAARPAREPATERTAASS